MDITANWFFPVGLGMLTALFVLLKRNAKPIPIKITKPQTRRR